MSSHIPENVRLKEKRDALLKAKQVAEALKKENVCLMFFYLCVVSRSLSQ